MAQAEAIEQEWLVRLQADLPHHSPTTYTSIIRWLIGEDPARLDDLDSQGLTIARQAMDYRYRILEKRYLNAGRERAYRNLIQRLGSLVLIRNKINTWIALSRDRQQRVTDVLQEVIQELLQKDQYMQSQIRWIARCSDDPRLRNALVLASTEEYCLRPIRNQPLLVYRFVNYLRASQKGGMTQVPADNYIRLVSEEIGPEEAEGTVSLLDDQALAQYREEQEWQEQQELRTVVAQRFAAYLQQELGDQGEKAAHWLRLFLQGHSQEAIAQNLQIPVQEVYRLREKVNYHATRRFAKKSQPELVASWLGRSN